MLYMSFIDIAYIVLSKYIGVDVMPAKVLKEIIVNSFSTFSHAGLRIHPIFLI
jgi:hypothetical protein